MPNPENILGQGFHTDPDRINRKGRPRKLISHVNLQLTGEGYKPATLDEIREAYLFLLNLPLSEIKKIADGKQDDYPLLYKLTAKELIGRRGMEMLEKLLDRAVGKAAQQTNVKVEDGNINIKIIERTDDDN